jgi:hypothetical protein
VVERVKFPLRFLSVGSISRTDFGTTTINRLKIMRPDMHKVVIERPRWNPGPGKNGRRANLPEELLPKFEGIKRPHLRRKGLTDLLGPLRRWLQAQIGRPWNDVYSEACAVIKPDSIIRAHVKTHLLQFVQRDTFMHDGKVCVLDLTYRSLGIVPVEDSVSRWQNLFFVHPETGVLQVTPQISRRAWRASRPKEPVTTRWIQGKHFALKQVRGLWFECHFKSVPVDVRFRAYDHALERVVVRSELIRRGDWYLLCTRKRQLSRRELREFGLRNTPLLCVVEAQSSANCMGWFKTALGFLLAVRQHFDGPKTWVIGHWFDSSSPDHIGA